MPARLDALDSTAPAAPLAEGTLSVKVLASGSSGNCLLVRAGSTTLLVDAGVSARTINGHLAERGVPPESIDAILLTHEHIDHVTGVGVFSRKYGTPVVADPRTLVAAKPIVGDFQQRPISLG